MHMSRTMTTENLIEKRRRESGRRKGWSCRRLPLPVVFRFYSGHLCSGFCACVDNYAAAFIGLGYTYEVFGILFSAKITDAVLNFRTSFDVTVCIRISNYFAYLSNNTAHRADG